jgi:RNA polymerase sigma-70 factor (ECF subfamily)
MRRHVPPHPAETGPPPGAPAAPNRFTVAGEASLRRRLVERDERALVELIELAGPWLLGLTRTLLGDADEAEEVVLEVFTTAWDRIGGLGEEHEMLLPWLFRIARNRAIDRLRRRRRQRRKLERAEAYGELATGEVAPATVDEAATPGWHVHQSVHAALAMLPDEQQEAVRMAYFEGLTHSEIARELGIPMGTVKTRLRLAFGKLRTALAPIRDWVS